MSFSKSTSKRFADTGDLKIFVSPFQPSSAEDETTASCAPPVGSYDVTQGKSKSSGPVTFEKGGRFVENNDQTPGPADIQPSFGTISLDVSYSSSIGNCSFVTPSKPVRRSQKLKSSSNTDLSCKELMSQQIHHLQYKVGELEKCLQRTVKEKNEIERNLKVLPKERDALLLRLEELQSRECGSCDQLRSDLDSCQNDMLNLKQENIELECQKRNLETDLELGSQNALVLQSQVSNLETQRDESMTQISELESTIWQLQVLLDQLRMEKMSCEDQILSIQANWKESQATLSELKRLHQDSKTALGRVQKDLEDERSQNEATNTILREYEHKFDLLSKERDSLKENVYNHQRANEQLESSRDEIAAQLSEIRSAKADLEEEMELLENTTTENLRCITLKYEALENGYDELKKESSLKESLLTSELEVTKSSYASLKEDLQTMRGTYNSLHLNYERMLLEAEDLDRQLKQAEKSHQSLKEEMESQEITFKANVVEHEAEKQILVSQINELSKVLEEKSSQDEHHRNEISNLKRTVDGLELERSTLSKRIEEMNGQIERRDIEVKRMKYQLEDVLSTKESSISKVKEELGKRIVETQAKLSSSEHSFIRKLELEQSRYNQLFADYESLQSKMNAEALSQDAQMWRTKYEDLESRTRPFQAQLELFEQEKRLLLSENDFKESEMAKLAENYAKILGHQNNKQKIHHIVKIKEENLSLKKEISKLRSQVSREKLAKKANSPKIDRKMKFDPSTAFQHSGKENSAPKALGQLKESNLNSTMSW